MPPLRLTATERRAEAIIKTAHELGMGGFALAKLRTCVTEQLLAEREDCALIAQAINSNRGNENEIANAIRNASKQS